MSSSGRESAPLGLTGATVADPARERLGRLIGRGSLVLALGLGLLAVWRGAVNPRSDDARITANVVGIAPRVSGPIVRLPIHDDQQVAAGDVLFEIDPEPYAIVVKTAQADLAALDGDIEKARGGIEAQESQVVAARAGLAQAEIGFAETRATYDRLQPLLSRRFTTAEAVGAARRARDAAAEAVQVARAELAAAEVAVLGLAPLLARRSAAAAALEGAELALRDTVVRAPFPARVVSLTISAGAFARIGIDTVTLIDTRQWWVLANFTETELRHIREGDAARLDLSTWPDAVTGVVESLGFGVTPMPEDPFPGLPIVMKNLDWVHLAQRFPVRIKIPADVPPEALRVGATAAATVLGRSTPAGG